MPASSQYTVRSCGFVNRRTRERIAVMSSLVIVAPQAPMAGRRLPIKQLIYGAYKDKLVAASNGLPVPIDYRGTRKWIRVRCLIIVTPDSVIPRRGIPAKYSRI